MSMFLRRLFVGLLCLALYSGAGWLPLVGPAAVSTTTFDPSNLGAGNTLSGGNLTVTETANGNSGNYQVARSITSHSTGKYYYEVLVQTINVSGAIDIGFANASQSLTAYLCINTNSVGAFDHTVGICVNNSTTGTSPSYGLTTVGIALDYGGSLFWIRDTAVPGTWNAGGTANPATGVGGISFAGVAAGPYFAAVALIDSTASSKVTANFGGTSYVASAPSGFGNY